MARPARFNPMQDLEEVEVINPDIGRVVRADGYGFYGKPVRLVRNNAGESVEFWLASNRLVAEAVYATEMTKRYAC